MTLIGLAEYLNENYESSIFSLAAESGETHHFHIHGNKILRGKIKENSNYEVSLEPEEGGPELNFLKIDIKIVYPSRLSKTITPLIKIDKKVKKKGLAPIWKVSDRGHIKNKTLYPLMKEREVLFFTLLEGEKLKGIIGGFSRYEIVLNAKGGAPVTILRHSVLDVRNKKGRCFLKKVQKEVQDWKKSPLFKR